MLYEVITRAGALHLPAQSEKRRPGKVRPPRSCLPKGRGSGLDGFLGGRRFAALGIGTQRRLAVLHALDTGIGDARGKEANGADGVVVAGDDVIDVVRVTVGSYNFV